MRLYQGKISPIANAIVKQLVAAEEIETQNPAQVQQDIEAVLSAYLQAEREIQQESRDLVASGGLPRHELGRVRRLVAERKGVGIGDEMIDYLLDQIVAMLMYSDAVDDVFVEDIALRRRMAPILKRELAQEEQLDTEARARLRHLQEGTPTWEIEYRKVMEDIRRRKGL